MECDWMREDRAFYLSLVMEFKAVAMEALTDLSARLEQECSRERQIPFDAVRDWFHCVHRLKGSAGTLGLDRISAPLGLLERAFSNVTESQIPMAHESIKGVMDVVIPLQQTVSALTPDALNAETTDCHVTSSPKEKAAYGAHG